MVIQNIHLTKYDWDIKVYYFIDSIYLNSIYNDLDYLGCPDIDDTIDILYKSWLNSGLSYTNGLLHSSLMVIGSTDSPEEFYSTFEHEKGHIVNHIALYYDMDLSGEEIQYLSGEIAKLTFPVAKYFLCNCHNCYIGRKSLIGRRIY